MTAQPATADLRMTRLIYAVLSIALVIPLVRWFYWPAAHGLDVTGHQIGRDFLNNWVGPQLAFGGHLATLFDLDGYHAALGRLFGQPVPFHNWGYPLFTLPAFWPLAQLPYFWALAVWTVGLFALFAAVTLSQVEQSQRSVALALLMLAPACLINTIGGQNGFLSGTLLLGGVLSIHRRPVLAGILFGLLTFKPHLGLVVPFVLVALGAWRVIAVAAVTAIVLVAATIPLFGVEPWRQYLEVTGGHQARLLEQFYGFFTIMMASVYAGARTLGLSYTVAMAIQVAVSVPVVGLACWAVRRTADPCRRAMIVAIATVLASPYAFDYDLTAVSAGLVWMLVGRLPWRTEHSAIYLLVWMAPLMMMYLNMVGLGVMPLALLALY
ncbi:MAG TPA: glycosyltransferase family 87 protein, partial [Candidatus Saccharimonadales bacterium]|nr:glycosyltransferase family 87 protein [Candidatus Saccharimonadales bacterium]